MSDAKLRPLVSVIVISYNQESYIGQAIESVLRQEYENLELIICDDASSDATSEIIRKYAEENPDKIKACINGENLGVTGNCNRGLNLSSGDLICVLGGDDYFLPGKIEAQVQEFEKNTNLAICGHQVEVFYENSALKNHNFRYSNPSGRGPKWVITKGGPYCAVSIMFSRTTMPAHGFDPAIPVHSDAMMWIECLVNGGDYVFINSIFAKYRRHSMNVTIDVDLGFDDRTIMFELLRERYPQYGNWIEIGYANLVVYPKAVVSIREGLLREAIERLFASMKKSPSNYKIYLRFLQVLSLAVRRSFRVTRT
jgi:glycosyltransferase involved in cell wall biosynthesis